MHNASRTLNAPWREQYLRSIAGDGASTPRGSTGCFLRDYWLAPEQDGANHVIERTPDDPSADAPTGGMILLNLFPYANGHLLVALGESRPRLLDYTPGQRRALWALVDRAMWLMERALEPHGVNVGLNQGAAAGAGVPQHAHVHLVPRWHGDVNFMTVVADVRVIPAAPAAMAARYREAAAAASP